MNTLNALFHLGRRVRLFRPHTGDVLVAADLVVAAPAQQAHIPPAFEIRPFVWWDQVTVEQRLESLAQQAHAAIETAREEKQ